jgi:hypothetical protein
MDNGVEALAKVILDRLVADQLIDAKDVAKLLPKLAEGKLRSEDWRLAIEKTIPRAER